MEIIFAFVATLLALILGFISMKKLLPQQTSQKVSSTVHEKEKTLNKKNMAICSTSPMPKKRHIEAKEETSADIEDDSCWGTKESYAADKFLTSGQFLGQDEKSVDDISDLLINSQDLYALDEMEGSVKPVKVKEFIRKLRENQLDDMTEEEKEQENRVQKQQLQEIFQMMQSSQNQHGINSFDDMEEQMKLYAIAK